MLDQSAKFQFCNFPCLARLNQLKSIFHLSVEHLKHNITRRRRRRSGNNTHSKMCNCVVWYFENGLPQQFYISIFKHSYFMLTTKVTFHHYHSVKKNFLSSRVWYFVLLMHFVDYLHIDEISSCKDHFVHFNQKILRNRLERK